jgi:hypothetical protein
MHTCPSCNGRLDVLPGVPSEQFGEFKQDVACPTCGFAIRKGQRVVVGSTTAAAVGAPKWSSLIVGCFALAFVIKLTAAGVFADPNGGWTFSWRDPMRVGYVLCMLFVAGMSARSVYRLAVADREAKAGFHADPRASAESNRDANPDATIAWIVAPGELRVVRADKSGEAAAPLASGEIGTIRAMELPRTPWTAGRPVQITVSRDAANQRPQTIYVSTKLPANELAASLLASVRQGA